MLEEGGIFTAKFCHAHACGGLAFGEILRGRSEHSTRSSGLVKHLLPLVGLVLVLISAIDRSTRGTRSTAHVLETTDLPRRHVQTMVTSQVTKLEGRKREEKREQRLYRA
jgi:hypothetical protein